MESSALAALGLPIVPLVAAKLSRGGYASIAASPLSENGSPLSAAKKNLQAAPQSAAPKDVKKVETAPAPAAAKPAATQPAPASGAPAKSLTEPVFLSDSWLFELSGCKILEASISGEPPKDGPAGHVKLSLVLDRTVFHPQGGGQPADVGELTAAGVPCLKVSFVSNRKEDGAVIHDCVTDKDTAEKWVSSKPSGVKCQIDEAHRRLVARLHSAGHLLDAAVREVDLRWVPGKGFHFADGPYVEYILNENSKKIDMKKDAEKAAVVSQIQTSLNKLVSAATPVSTRYEGGVRRVEMVGEECPCGGTHVKTTAEIGEVHIKKIQVKQGNIRVSYQLAAPAA
eukprot:TRINITY_DN24499_c0_g1_i1.p1 TRINITY_DN24499_c0_g1~~TRINITY_DN24499_c0_g1_i1.p1  ORF type:complete len:341 (-),score=63.23 TRINITY_DN24499_c0_g1_i1:198-1220(-)